VIWFREKKLDGIGRASKVPLTLLAPLQDDFSAVTTSASIGVRSGLDPYRSANS
jgi:hypothetical protein